jgi:hypothetical protein
MLMVDVEHLERGAEDGDPAALTAIGKLALVGRAGTRSPGEGAQLLARAATAGSPEAAAVIATLIAAEARSVSDWQLALRYLERAACQGWLPACRQLAFLGGDRDLATRSQAPSLPSELWQRMRASVDIMSQTRAAPARQVFEAPRLAIVERFASPSECAWMIGLARPRVARATVFDRKLGCATYDEARTNSAVLFNIIETDLVLLVLRARIAATCGVPTNALEETNVLHYAQGEEFRAHYDFLDTRHPGFKRELLDQGQRSLTFLVYLNDDFVGGETSFPNLGWSFRGRTGDALLLANVDRSGAPDSKTLHAGLAPSQGEKWLLSQWIRKRPGAQNSHVAC